MEVKNEYQNSQELQANHFDELAIKSGLSLYNDSPQHSQNEIRRLILGAMKHSPDAEVLEIGAGKGQYTLFLLAQGFRVTANDVSKAALQVLISQAKDRQLDKLLKIQHGDIASAPEKSNSYDFVFFADTLHHLEYEQTIQILESIHPLIRQGGQLIAWEPNGRYPFWRQMHLINPDFVWEYEKNITHCTKKDFSDKFSLSGWEMQEYLNHRILPMPLLDRFPFFRWLDRQLMKIPAIRFRSAYSLIVAKPSHIVGSLCDRKFSADEGR